MNLCGKNYINGDWVSDYEQPSFNPFNPLTNQSSSDSVCNASKEEVAKACLAADAAFMCYRNTSAEDKAQFLTCIGQQIMALGDVLLNTTQQETGLPLTRLRNERARTIFQLQSFADALMCAEQVCEDQGDPDRQPVAKPQTRLSYLPLGPVAVFGASNFPYAFSTAGGDTASALAAGCPVIVKSHPAHPFTNELITLAIHRAIEQCHLPKGLFSMLQGNTPELSHQLVAHPSIKAVGFTGSQAVATQLQKTVFQRHEVIPFYGELGSVNPQIVLPQIGENFGAELGEQLSLSMLMGNGQFCTNPGVWLVPHSGSQLIRSAKATVQHAESAAFLTPGIQHSYESSTQTLAINNHITNLAQSKVIKAYHSPAQLFQTDAEVFVSNPQLRQEIFGPCALIVTYKNQQQLDSIVNGLEGQLTASIHGTESELQQQSQLITSLSYKVGRLIFNQMPTGVEVCSSMNHGGPFPASTDVRTTSVGRNAMQRFLRPICYQNMPKNLK